MKLQSKQLVITALTGMVVACQPTAKDEKVNNAVKRPNVVLIVADDHGRGDAGCYGNKAISTPNIDYLASQGIRMTNAYCTSASCSASRSTLLTGQYNHSNGQFGHGHAFHHFSAHSSIKSLPVLLEQNGYNTARIGKYHVDPEEVFHFQTVLQANSRNSVAMADSCSNYLKAQGNNPFFLYFCTSDPHRGGGFVEDNPFRPDRFGNKEEGYSGVVTKIFSPDSVIVPEYLPDTRACREELAQYYQSVHRFDQGLKILFDDLKENGQWENTIIIYLSDNGIAFAGAKTTLYDPGMHLPCIIKYPESGRKGEVNDAMFTWADITPTIIDMVGLMPKVELELRKEHENNSRYWEKNWKYAFNGNSFKQALLLGDSKGFDKIFASHTFHEITMYYPMRVVQNREYKLIYNIAHGLPYPHASDLWESATWQSVLKSPGQMYAHKSIKDYSYRPEFELFDMVNDPEESNNLANDPKYAEILQELKKEIIDNQERTNDPWIVKWEHE